MIFSKSEICERNVHKYLQIHDISKGIHLQKFPATVVFSTHPQQILVPVY